MWIRADSSARGGESRIGTLNRTAEDFKRFSPAPNAFEENYRLLATRLALDEVLSLTLPAAPVRHSPPQTQRPCSTLSKHWKRLNGGTIHLPGRMKDRPDRDRLAIGFERFKAVA
jgi:hypothetical protein